MESSSHVLIDDRYEFNITRYQSHPMSEDLLVNEHIRNLNWHDQHVKTDLD